MGLVLSFSLHLCAREICDACISDHFAVLFSVLSCSQVKSCAPESCVCKINPSTASQVSAAFGCSVLCVRDYYCRVSMQLFSILHVLILWMQWLLIAISIPGP